MTITCEYQDEGCTDEVDVVVRPEQRTRLLCRNCWERWIERMVLLEVPPE